MTQLADQQYRRLFKALPGKIIVLQPDDYLIVAVTDAYLQATMTREGDILGRTLFEVFPDDPQDELAQGEKNLSASLARVRSLKTTDIVGILRYPVRRPDGSFEERFWTPVNSPVLDDAGEIEFIMHRVEDVTTIVQEGHGLQVPDPTDAGVSIAVQDIILRSRELRQSLSKLQEHEARMRTAERLLNLGAWEYDLETQQLNWSRQVFEIFDVPPGQAPPDFDGYVALLHPEDRDRFRSDYQTFRDQRAPQFEFEHRIITRDGSLKYIKGVGERHRSAAGEILVGYVQDLSTLVVTRRRLDRAEQLLRLAGERVQLGGWRVELDSETILWTAETAAIHGTASTAAPRNVSEAVQFYMPEYRKLVRDKFDRCAQFGEEFDLVCQLQTADGRHPWIRVIGVAERDDDGRIRAVQGALQDISRLREAQEQAEAADRQRVDVLERISDAFYTLDLDWNFTYVNRKASELLERSREELLGRNIWQAFPEAAASPIQTHYEWARQHRRTARFHEYYAPLEKWFEISAYPLPDGLAVYFRDVTQDRERREQLRLVEAALSRQNDIVMITEAEPIDAPHGPRIVYVNDAFERQTGYSRSDALGNTPRLLHGPQTDRQQLDRIRTALESQQPIRCEVQNYTKAGNPYWLELDITPLFDATGRCTHYVAVERDISQRKAQETALRQAQERFELISRATNDVVWDWDLTTERIWWNQSLTDLFGYTVSELEAGPHAWARLVHPEDRERVVRSIYDAIGGDEELWNAEYRFIRSDGQSANVIDRGFVIRNQDGEATRMVGSMIDITDRKEMETRLRESQKLEAVGHLTGGVAHDFNNLLTVILGNAESLAELLTDPALRPMAEMTVSAAERGAELTSRLLAFARRRPLDPRPTDLNSLVQGMQTLVRRTLPENIELEFRLDPGLGMAEVDASELDTALLNLVVNARDAMPEGGSLVIETANIRLDEGHVDSDPEVGAGDYVMICVADTGIGMDHETARHAFEPFFTTKAVGKGSGLGLSMVFGFTKQSGGHIMIDSEPDEGTSVRLYFPRASHNRQAADAIHSDEAVQGGNEHILIAEDDDLVLSHLREQLRTLGYRVTAASSGPEALQALAQHADVDLLLTDIVMSGEMNGRELADRAWATNGSLKVLFTSGYTESAIVHDGRLDPGLDLLNKPYTRLELATKVRLVLDKKAPSDS